MTQRQEERAGERWSEGEDGLLREYLHAGWAVPAIARVVQRSEDAVVSRLVKIRAVRYDIDRGVYYFKRESVFGWKRVDVYYVSAQEREIRKYIRPWHGG